MQAIVLALFLAAFIVASEPSVMSIDSLQLPLWHLTNCRTAVQTSGYDWKHPDDRLVQAVESSEVESKLTAERAPIY